MIKKIVTLVASASIIGCTGGVKIDPASALITDADREVAQIPDVCRSAAFTDKPRVAVAAFLNNTSYGDMTASNTHITGQARSNTLGAGASKNIGSRTVISGGASASRTTYTAQADTYMRQIAPQIGEYAQSATENIVSNLGSMIIYDRSSLSALLNEQKFQMAVADPDTMVEMGKLAGVEYILTGSVDSIDARYIQPLDDKGRSTGDAWADFALSLTHMMVNTQTGWVVNVEMSVKMIEVETGRVLVNRKMEGKQMTGGGSGINPELVAEAAKRAMGQAVQSLREELIDHFSPRGYVTHTRNNKEILLLNIGRSEGIKTGDKLNVYELIEIHDPFTGSRECNMLKIPVTVTVSDQISSNQAWVKAKGSKSAVSRIKIGTVVMKNK